MANLRSIKRRIRSVSNTAKVTRAMQMIAATKMRRSQERALSARPYAQKLHEVLGELLAQQSLGDELNHPLLEDRIIRKSLMIHFSPDKGLCGGMPSNMNRKAAQYILDSPTPVGVITVGKKGRDFMVRSGQDVKGVFVDLGDRPSLSVVLPIVRLVEQMYSSGEIDEVIIGYTRFVNMVVQEPVIFPILPVKADDISESQTGGEYLYEPDATQVFATLIPRYLEVQLYRALLESIASEQSARMVAMRNATEAASDMVDSLTLAMNKVRQETITNELLDIVGGAAALAN